LNLEVDLKQEAQNKTMKSKLGPDEEKTGKSKLKTMKRAKEENNVCRKNDLVGQSQER